MALATVLNVIGRLQGQIDGAGPAQPRPVGIMTLRNRTLSPSVDRFIHCARQLAKPLSKA
jgi:hypothetical protein